MKAIELREYRGGFTLACYVLENTIEPETLTELTQEELRTLLARTARDDLRFEIGRLLDQKIMQTV